MPKIATSPNILIVNRLAIVNLQEINIKVQELPIDNPVGVPSKRSSKTEDRGAGNKRFLDDIRPGVEIIE